MLANKESELIKRVIRAQTAQIPQDTMIITDAHDDPNPLPVRESILD